MKKYRWIGGLVMLAGLFSACGDFLEPQSQEYFVPGTAQQINDMLLGSAYPKNNIHAGSNITAMIQIMDDDTELIPELASIYSWETEKYTALRYLHTWQPDMDVAISSLSGSDPQKYFVNLWERNYKLMLGANAGIDYVDKVEGTRDEKNLVKGQSYALRAFYYFNLVNLYGKPYSDSPDSPGVPLVLSSSPEKKEIPRQTVRKVYEQILQDLDDAEACYEALPERFRYRPDLRTSLPMVQLLKSRVFLHMENWEEAARYAQKVIGNGNFKLKNLNDLGAPAARRATYPMVSKESPETIWLYGNYYELLYYTGSLTLNTPSSSVYAMRASQDLLKGYVEGDLRQDWYFGPDWDRVSHAAFGKLELFVGTSLWGEAFSRVFRLSEAYLNLAEAAAMNSDEETAREAVNTLRKYRFTPEKYAPITLTGEELLRFVRQERRLELCLEGHRWFDLRRYGMPAISHAWRNDPSAAASVTYTLKEKDPGYTLPIPEDVLSNNRMLEQNPLAPQRLPD